MPSEDDTGTQQLKIWQQNCRKSLVNQLHVINSLNPDSFDICLIQEPYIDFINNTRAPAGWKVIYPPTRYTNGDRTRSVILVSPRLATSNWMDLCINSPDVTAIQLWGSFGNLMILNIYNDCEHADSLKTIEEWHNNPRKVSLPPTSPNNAHGPPILVWAGDFNRHHPLWEEEKNEHLFTRDTLEKARPIIEMLAGHDMEMALPKDTPTLEHSSTGNWTRPDNVFISSHAHERIVKCDVEPERRPPRADHLPIITVLDIEPRKATHVE
jgi:hypothetical protein